MGNGGPNLISSFPVIGEVVGAVYGEGAIGGGAPAKNVQPRAHPGRRGCHRGHDARCAGMLPAVDHGIVRATEKGALGVLEVTGREQPGISRMLSAGTGGIGGHR